MLNINFEEGNQGLNEGGLPPKTTEMVQTKRIMREKDLLDTNNHMSDSKLQITYLSEIDSHLERVLVLNRVLGHEKEFSVDQSRWQLQTSNDRDCWICDKLIYSVLFWNQGIGSLMN